MYLIYFLRFALRIVLHVIGSLQVTGRENIPESGPYILAVNHMSKADPPLVFLTLPPLRMRFFAGEKWERHLIFGPLMKWVGAVYINRGQVDRGALKEALEALKGGSIFGLAPEGTRSKEGALIKGRDGASYLAIRAGVPVLPVAVVNTDVIGHNIARLRRTRAELHIGEPFLMPQIGRRPKSSELAAFTHYLMIKIAIMLPERYWGSYAHSPALLALQNGEDPWKLCWEAESIPFPTVGDVEQL